ncbi:nitrilase-related carbon-nitrogen hydrolase [Clostridium frigidicarnis]|uniref:Carbon-nitrogen hydrolase n=1 Tax=Clostridium frigidicarnis TaxID=84698 RepID=A0A1I1A3L9_9CLOT|nr:nitrilase-related carbon-nitrogen hydrolase [Clostridium frigidicarnis]SFB32624.1 Carbon-nitrogen hydrolase [Clostridium frigidicarnis]
MKVALCQLNIVWENKNANKNKVQFFIEKCKKYNCDFAIFPEMTLTGFSMNTLEIKEKNSNDCDTIKWFCKLSQKFHINIAFGCVQEYKNKAKNNLLIVSKSGDVLSSYSKIHPFSFGEESNFYVGGDDFVITPINNFIFGSTICYDLRFPELFQILSKKSHAIIVIANWPQSRREHWISLLKSRAIENQCYILGVNRVGLGNDLYYSGDSSIISPDGTIIKTLFNKEGLIIGDLDLDLVTNLRETFNVKNDRKEDLYILGYKGV